VTPAWTTTPANDSVFMLVPAGSDVKTMALTVQTARDIGASVLLSSGTGTGQLNFTSGIVDVNMTKILGTAVSAPATAGVLDVNIKNIANAAVSTSSAQLGVNVVNYAGQAALLDANNLPKVDIEDIAGAAVSNTTAQLGVNVVKFGATTVTGRDIGASVLL